MSRSPEDDLAAVSDGRPRRVYAPDDVIRDRPEDERDVLLLSRGTALLAAETHFGPHPIGPLSAPVFLTLHRALTGSSNLCRFEPRAGAEAIVFSPEEARALLFAPSIAGAAFRRLALASITLALREVNQSLRRFFDPANPEPGHGGPAFAGLPPDAPAAPAAQPADPRRVNDLFDAAGLDPHSLPDLGLSARKVDGGSRLVQAGDRGHEAFLVVEGLLRVSIRIPGVGEEALAFLGPGEIVGEMALVDDAPRSADVYAHGGPALVFSLPREAFRHLLDAAPEGGAPLVGGIAVALARRFEEAVLKAASFRILAGPF